MISPLVYVFNATDGSTFGIKRLFATSSSRIGNVNHTSAILEEQITRTWE